MSTEIFAGKVGLQQRVIPAYRAAFFDTLAQKISGGLSVFAGKPLPKEGIAPVTELRVAQLVAAHNRNLFDPSSAWFMCWQGGFIEWLEAWQPDVLVVEANPRYPTTRTAIAWMHTRQRKVIGWGMGAPPLGGMFAALRNKQRIDLLRSLDGIIAYSRQGAEQYRAMGLPAHRIYVASNAAVPAPTAHPLHPPPDFSARPVVLFVGRLQKRKRVDLLLQACAGLPSTLQPRLVIVGDGPATEELQQLATRVYPEAEFMGAKQGVELESYYAQADLFVLPGTGGLAIQQAMAHGLPVVVAQGDGTQEDLVRPDNGWQVLPNDLGSLITVLKEALSDPNRLRRMGEAAYRIVAEEINVEKMAGVFIRAIRELLNV